MYQPYFYFCIGVAIVIFFILLLALIHFRKMKNPEENFHKQLSTEIAWTVIPLLIFFALTVPAMYLLYYNPPI